MKRFIVRLFIVFMGAAFLGVLPASGQSSGPPTVFYAASMGALYDEPFRFAAPHGSENRVSMRLTTQWNRSAIPVLNLADSDQAFYQLVDRVAAGDILDRKIDTATVFLRDHHQLDHMQQKECPQRRNRCLVPIGATSIFSNFPPMFQRKHLGDSGQIAWVGFGWIRWSDFKTKYNDGIRARGDCDRDGDWGPRQQCLEKVGDDSYIIKQKQGHTGWSVEAIGSIRSGKANTEFYKWYGDEAASEVLRDYFIVVPHDKVRARRTVSFEFHFTDGSKPLTASGDAALPNQETAPPPGKLTACGTAAACPNYMIPPERETAVRRSLGLPPR